ncbi:MAG: electron transfer flavoprotein [Candidatus Aminicenantes bacterium RBG_16_63_16]|nr:MAG: electron transfer flavoprotein [Candidatus Aminicenantes bacterium RBG_16_63_16]
MLSPVENVLFGIIFTLAVVMFLKSSIELVRLVLVGKPDNRLKGQIWKRILSMLEYAFLQKRVVSERYGINHFVIFWGFIVLLFANIEFVLAGLFPGFAYHKIIGATLGRLAYFCFDVVSLAMIASMAVAYFRRLVIKPSHIEYRSPEGFIILSLIVGLMMAFFGLHGAEIAMGKAFAPNAMPFSRYVVAPLLTNVSPSTLVVMTKIFWWLHALIFLFFLNYLPFSKHMHILWAIPNCFCRSYERIPIVPREEFNIGRPSGVSIVDEFSWKDLLDFFSCTECGRCNANCPATTVGKVLNPRLIIHDGKVNLRANGTKIRNGNRTNRLLPLITEETNRAGSISEEALWACTTCGACMANCPVFIEHVPKIIKMRRHLAENLAKFPEELAVFFEAEEQRSNPWGIAPAERDKWAKDANLRRFVEGSNPEYLLYAGCAASFDSRNKKVCLAVVKALTAAGISFGILGNEEKCCGDSLRRLGNEFVFEKFAKANVAQFEKLGVKKIITICPHCYSTFKNDYPQFGFGAEVHHHSEFLPRLVREGKLELKGTNGFGRVLFHDSCYLGRHNDIYEQPRELIVCATGQRALEFDRRLAKSFCCGAGGGRMWMEEHPEQRVNINRVKEALEKKPDVIAVACPYCMTMFTDGAKDLKAQDKVHVLDIAEIVAESIKV